MHVVEVFGRIFISSLFIIEAVRKFFSPDEGMMYMSQYGVPEVLFYPSLVFEFIVCMPDFCDTAVSETWPKIRLISLSDMGVGLSEDPKKPLTF